MGIVERTGYSEGAGLVNRADVQNTPVVFRDGRDSRDYRDPPAADATRSVLVFLLSLSSLKPGWLV